MVKTDFAKVAAFILKRASSTGPTGTGISTDRNEPHLLGLPEQEFQTDRNGPHQPGQAERQFQLAETVSRAGEK